MKKKNIPVEFVYQLFALIIAIIVVHAFYVSIVRPNAAEALAAQAIEREANPDYVTERSTWVLIKDMEQEACFVLKCLNFITVYFWQFEIQHPDGRDCQSHDSPF